MTFRPVLNFFQVSLVVLLLVAVALLAAIATMNFSIHGAEVTVPPLKGLTVAEARSQTSALGLDLDVDNRYYSGEVASGHILTQSPVPGTVVRREWHVRVSESLGQQRVDVPSVVGLEERMAALQLRRAGLEVGTTARLPYGAAPEGTVLAQDPPAHAQGIAQPSINLLVAAPVNIAPDGFVMPGLTGLPLASAQAELAKVGMKSVVSHFVEVAVGPVGQAEAPPKPPVRPGTVITQQPPAGARADQQTLVKLTVAK